MRCPHFWLSEDQFARLAPHLPTDTRGLPRVDDRRVISGFVHVLKSGGRWADAPSVYGLRKTLYNRFVRWAAKGVWSDIFDALASAGGPPAEVLIDSTAVRADRCAAGGKGGSAARRSAAHAGRADHQDPRPDGCLLRPVAFLLTGGQVADCTAADALLDQMPVTSILHGDKGYDSNAVRRKIEARGAAPNIPPKAQQALEELLLAPSLPGPQRHRTHVRADQRLPTRYDRLASNFLAAVCLVATVCYWL